MAINTKRWTLAELHSLPDDGNKYELVEGELFVTPAPTPRHERILGRLTRILTPYVEANGLGRVYHPRSVVRFRDSEVEPDLMVRNEIPNDLTDWGKAPVPILVVEVISEFTRQREHVEKRTFYLDAAIAEYWIVDPDERSICIVKANHHDDIVTERLQWSPTGSREPLSIQLSEVFGD
jgi:Uma2 family endonuclease